MELRGERPEPKWADQDTDEQESDDRIYADAGKSGYHDTGGAQYDQSVAETFGLEFACHGHLLRTCSPQREGALTNKKARDFGLAPFDA